MCFLTIKNVRNLNVFSYIRILMCFFIKVRNNTINEPAVPKFFGVNHDKMLSFENHVKLVSPKLAKSIGLLYKLNRFLPETIVLQFILFILSYQMVQKHGLEHIKIIPPKFSSIRRKPCVQ